jgi:PadR family transcriptional regulator PadR
VGILVADSQGLQTQLNSGVTSLVLLSLLQQEKRAMYGYEIAQELEVRWQEELPMKPGALYPVLRSLEKQGLLSSYMEPSEAGPPRKYYEMTSEGKATLKHWRQAWQTTTQFVDCILETDHARFLRKGRSKLSGKPQAEAR